MLRYISFRYLLSIIGLLSLCATAGCATTAHMVALPTVGRDVAADHPAARVRFDTRDEKDATVVNV